MTPKSNSPELRLLATIRVVCEKQGLAISTINKKLRIFSRLFKFINDLSMKELTCYFLEYHISKGKPLPESFGSLTNLKTLTLSKNELTSLPPTLRCLEKLYYLNLDYNSGLGKKSRVIGDFGNPKHGQKHVKTFLSEL